MISSTANPSIRRVRRLRKRLWRERRARVLVEGHRAIASALAAGARLEEVFYTASAERLRPELLAAARASGGTLRMVTRDVMAHLTSVSTAPDVLAVAPMPGTTLAAVRSAPAPGVILAGVHDPATAGAIIATAFAVGGRAAIATNGTVDVFEAKTLRAAQGAHFHLSLVRDVPDADAVAAATAGGARVVSLCEDGPPPWELDLRGALMLRVEGEAGATAPVEGARVAVPALGAVRPSLTARAAVVLYEWVRQGGTS